MHYERYGAQRVAFYRRLLVTMVVLSGLAALSPDKLRQGGTRTSLLIKLMNNEEKPVFANCKYNAWKKSTAELRSCLYRNV